MYRFWQIFVFTLIVSQTVFSQATSVIDSLTKIIKDPASHDSTKIKAAGDLSWEYLGSDLQKALQFANLELTLAERNNRKADIAQAHSDIGSIYNRKGSFDTALVYYYKAMQLREDLKQDQKVAGVYSNIATIYTRQSKFQEALDINFKSLKIFEKYDDPTSIAKQGIILGNIGNLYYELEMNKVAEGFYRKGLYIAVKSKDVSAQANLLVNLGGIKFEYNDIDSSLYYFLKAEKIATEAGLLYTLAAIYNDVGRIYYTKKDYDKAAGYYEKGLAAREQIGDPYGMGLSLSNIAEIYLMQNRDKEAIKHLNRCVDIFTELKNYVNLMQVYQKLAVAHEKTSQYSDALKYMNLYASMKDSLYNQSNSEKLTEMQVKYETEKKEKDNALLQKENTEKNLALTRRRNQMIIGISAFLLLAISFVFLYHRSKLKQKQAQDAELLRQQTLRNKAIIEAEERERVRIARELHDGVGQLLSAAKMNLSSYSKQHGPAQAVSDAPLLKNALEMIDDSVREVRAVSHNMLPSVLTRSGLKEAVIDFAGKINSTGALQINTEFVDMDERLDQTAELIIYRVLQELTSNCLKHAGATELNLQIVNHGDELVVMAEDNGKGFDPTLINTEKGIGLKNIQSRISFLNGTVEFDTSPGKGTTVIIEIPVVKV